MMKFNNKPNKSYNIGTKIVWESRSIAVNCVILIKRKNKEIPEVLISRRGPNAADFQGLMNVVAGYLDYNETGTEAVYRETWEECGVDLEKLSMDNIIKRIDLLEPWYVNTRPTENKQNISLRYGVYIHLDTDELPDVSLIYNEVDGEVSEIYWLPINKIDQHDWAFNHDKTIKEYISKIETEELSQYL